MKITIAAVGRARRGPHAALYRHYVDRLSWAVALAEIEAREAPAGPRRIRAEADRLAAAIPDGAAVVALDAAGALADSPDLARRLGDWRDMARPVAFLIGGADGLADDLLRRADLRLSLGRLTWPHMLVRVMLAEQIYRCQQILAGHPYHHG